MKNSEKSIEEYLKKISDTLVCPKGTKKLVIAQLRDTLTSYFADHPDSKEEDLYAVFGTPERFAELLCERDDYVRMIREEKKRCKRIAFCCAVLTVLAVAFFVAVVLMIREAGGKITVTDVHAAAANTIYRIGIMN